MDLQSDVANCGQCGRACTNQVCSAGSCTTNCGTGLTNCSSSCVNLQTDSVHCGNCATACAGGQSCSNGACACTGGQTLCSGTCVNTSTDANNCGACGTTCSGGRTCTGGACSCPSGKTYCGQSCVSTTTDVNNCGACGTACPGGQTCTNGACTCPNAGEKLCNGACIDVQSDAANCGDCSINCSPSTCTNGACTQSSCGDQTYSDTYTPGYDGSYHSQAVTGVNNMSVTDRLLQMQGIDWGNSTTQNWNDIFRSANTATVAGFKFRDGPRGVNLDAPIASGSTSGTAYTTATVGGGTSTVFPVPMARGASFDLDLEYRIGQAIGDETLAARQTMQLAPTVNILRHPYWGRAQETYGEDVFLLGRMGSALVVGMQEYIPACAKHYAANNIENGRASMNATMDEQTLREMFARHFEMIIKDGGVACIMAAYNKVNGTNCTQNTHLLTDILRTDFGFKGFVLSDWWAIPGGSGARSATTDTLRTTAAAAVNAGLDMELPWNLFFSQLSAIRDQTGGVTTAQITTAATRVYEQKIRFNVAATSGTIGKKAPTSGYSSPNITNNQSHIDLAYKAALEGSVLLKNNNNTLPIASTVKNVAVIGASVPYTLRFDGATTDTNGRVNFATDIRIGDVGSSRANPASGSVVGPFAGIQSAAPSGVTVTNGTSASAAANADFVVVVAGLTARDEGEEYTGAGDRTTCDLDGKENAGVQNALIASVAALGKPMVVVLEGGSVINVEPWLSSVPAVVMAWYPGMVGGKALGELLFGKQNFSGKLPISWPVSCTNDEPAFSSGSTSAQDYYFGYRYFDQNNKTPRFPFGHGLSYTTFQYSNLRTPCSDVTKNGVIELDVVVKNTGSVAGTETVLAFATYPSASARRPKKELKGFTRVDLAAGQSKQVKILIRTSDLKYYNGGWTVDTGNVTFRVGPSANGPFLDVTVPVK